ncbi:MAG: cation:proton antiporter [Methanimicrococcus sp.]|nr:cation:proton antiporter [Methanimicrococcus sp.]
MVTIIAKTISRGVLMIGMLFSINLLLYGASYPGGGFVGGVLFICGIALVYVTYGMKYINTRLRPNWSAWVAYGLLFASLTAIAPMLVNHNYFRSAFEFFHVEFFGIHIGHIELASAMMFDIGVYFTVIGSLLFILTTIALDKVKEPTSFFVKISDHSDPAGNPDETGEVDLKPKNPAHAAQAAETTKTEGSK